MTESQRYRVLDLRPSDGEAIKPSELIQITGHQSLSLYARRAITILWHNAHEQGIQPGRLYSIELSRLRSDQHRGLGVVEDAIESLMTTLIITKLADGRTRRVQFLGGNDMDDPDRPAGTLRYSFDPLLIEILRDSEVWGKIALPVLMSFSSKYSVSLYENVSQWLGLTHKTIHDVSLDGFRDMLGVEEGKYEAFGALNKHVIKPVVDEINALAPFGITVVPVKDGRRVARIRIGWWQKSADELREAYAEADRPKIGRRSRISGRVEYVSPMASVFKAGQQARLERRRSVVVDNDVE